MHQTLSVGDHWTYSMRGTEWDGESLLRLVLAEETPAHYVLAAASLADATVHAVMNYMPFLGRLTRSTPHPLQPRPQPSCFCPLAQRVLLSRSGVSRI